MVDIICKFWSWYYPSNLNGPMWPPIIGIILCILAVIGYLAWNWDEEFNDFSDDDFCFAAFLIVGAFVVGAAFPVVVIVGFWVGLIVGYFKLVKLCGNKYREKNAIKIRFKKELKEQYERAGLL